MLNLAMSDRADGGMLVGRMVNLIGDSSSGKSLLALSAAAEMCNDERFDDYRIIFDDVEAAFTFDVEYMFGKNLSKRIESPDKDEDGDPMPSATVEDFLMHVEDAISEDVPFIYILDSLDALTSEQDEKKVEDMLSAKRKGKETSGDYGMAKAKGMSSLFRHIIRRLAKSKSILLIISQTRDNISYTSFATKTRSGGRALKFYATHEIWLAVAKAEKSKEREIGAKVKAKVSKNKVTGKKRLADFSVYYDYGVDDIKSMIDFLHAEGAIKKKKQTYIIDELDVQGTIGVIIKKIEKGNLEDDLKEMCQETWNEIEEGLKLCRKRKYR